MDWIYFDEGELKHPLYGRNIVFTGAMQSMTRSEAARRVKSFNATVQGVVRPDTDFVILGDKRRGVSTKQLQAERLIAEGYAIQILYEDDFLWLLAQNIKQ